MTHKSTFHLWLRSHYDIPNHCEICGEERKLDLANIKNHAYTRDLQDYAWICRSCHVKMDMTEERKKKISNSMKGIKNRKGTIQTESAKNKIREHMLRIWKERKKNERRN